MIKKIFLLILVLLLFVVGGYLILRYIHYVKDKDPYKTFLSPRVEKSVFKITYLSKEKTNLLAEILIDNPLPLGFSADSMHYQFSIDDVKVASATYAKPFTIKRNDSSWISLPITLLNKDLVSVLKLAEKEKKDSVDYELITAVYKDFFFKKEVNMGIKKKLPLFHLMEVKMEKIEIDSLNLTRAVLLVNLSIHNKNLFAIGIKNLKYVFAFEGDALAEGKKDGLIHIPPNSYEKIQLPLHVTLKEFGSSAFTFLKEGEDMKYRMNVSFKVDSENAMLKDSQVELENFDSVKDIKRLFKKAR